MTASLRNSLHRRNHKERSQLAHRARFGILEKHKDYVLRARDYHSKQDRVTRLRQKAADRNKDEFYFGMVRQKTERGVHVQDRGNQSLPVDIVKVLKSQDENYLRTMRTAGLKKIDKIKSQLSSIADLFGSLSEEDTEELGEEELETLKEAGVIPSSSTGSKKKRKTVKRSTKHIFFAEDEDEAKQYVSSSKSSLNDEPMQSAEEEAEIDMGWKAPVETKKSKKSKSKATAIGMEVDEEERKQNAAEHRTKLLKELSARLHRDKQLRYAEREMEMQKLLMGKGTSRKMQGVERVDEEDDEDEDEDEGSRKPKKVDEKTWKPRVYKWKVERKR
ncbi:UTP11 family protein [Abortiporus biennis]